MHKQVVSATLGGATMDGEGWSASSDEVGDEDGEIAPFPRTDAPRMRCEWAKASVRGRQRARHAGDEALS